MNKHTNRQIVDFANLFAVLDILYNVKGKKPKTSVFLLCFSIDPYLWIAKIVA